MTDLEERHRGTFASSLGGLVGLLAKELGAAAAVVFGLWAGYSAIAAAERSKDNPWPLYLIGGGIFVAILIACRWRGRA